VQCGRQHATGQRRCCRPRPGRSPPTPFAEAPGVGDEGSVAIEDVTSFEEFGAVQSLLNRMFWTQLSR
jgi:hypothetical protein